METRELERNNKVKAARTGTSEENREETGRDQLEAQMASSEPMRHTSSQTSDAVGRSEGSGLVMRRMSSRTASGTT